jgi:hypothetical protein
VYFALIERFCSSGGSGQTQSHNENVCDVRGTFVYDWAILAHRALTEIRRWRCQGCAQTNSPVHISACAKIGLEETSFVASVAVVVPVNQNEKYVRICTRDSWGLTKEERKNKPE